MAAGKDLVSPYLWLRVLRRLHALGTPTPIGGTAPPGRAMLSSWVEQKSAFRRVQNQLAEAHVMTYRTDLAVRFELDGKTVSPSLPEFR